MTLFIYNIMTFFRSAFLSDEENDKLYLLYLEEQKRNEEEIKRNQQIWRMSNLRTKEENKIYNEKYRENNKEKFKEKVVCECGSILTKYKLKRHLESKKHRDYLTRLI